MNTLVLLFFTITTILGILGLTAQAIPVKSTSIPPSVSPTPSSEQRHASLSTYNEMVMKIINVQQEIRKILKTFSSNFTNYTAAQAQRFEYCFLKDVANPPGNNLMIEERMLIDYEVLEELTIPLRDVVNYEEHVNNDSDKYAKLMWTQSQINTSLEEIQNTQNSDLLMEQLVPRSSEDSRSSMSSNTTSNNTQVEQGRCNSLVKNFVDEYRDLMELYIGLTFIVRDLLDIEHELNPH